VSPFQENETDALKQLMFLLESRLPHTLLPSYRAVPREENTVRHHTHTRVAPVYLLPNFRTLSTYPETCRVLDGVSKHAGIRMQAFKVHILTAF
jgi:hypothetical protein